MAEDPYLNFRYAVEIGGKRIGYFHECAGIESTIDVIEHREGGENITVRKIPGLVKYSNLTLKWGILPDTELYAWHQKILEGDIDRRAVAVVIQSRKGEDQARWEFTDAWPCKYTGPSLAAEGNDVGVETIELAHSGMKRTK